MNDSAHVVRFRHRTVVEMLPLAEVLPPEAQRRHQERRERATRRAEEHEQNLISKTNPHAAHGEPPPDRYYRAVELFPPGWYGVGAGGCWWADGGCARDDGWTALEFSCDAGCRVRTADLATAASDTVDDWASPVRLDDAPLTADLLDPVRHFFRHPDEAGFWDRVASDPLDDDARLGYADWLDGRDDPHAWVFREPRPFSAGPFRLGWVGAMGRVNCGTPEHPPTVWDFARATGQGAAVPYTLSDGSPLPQFVAYLLGVARIRADLRLPDADRTSLAPQARRLGLGLMGDLLVGPDDGPICRVTDPVRTTALLGGLAGRAGVTPAALAARLREVNRAATGSADQPTPPTDTTTGHDGGADGSGRGERRDAPPPPDGGGPTDPLPHLCLLGLNDEFAGREWSFNTAFEVGRLPDAGLRLDVATPNGVSRRHAVVFPDEGRWWVGDRGSTNGTCLNGTPVGAESAGPLRAGDVLQFARFALRVDLAAIPLAEALVAAPRFSDRERLLARCGCARRFAHLFRAEHVALVGHAERVADGDVPPRPPKPVEPDPLTELVNALASDDTGNGDYYFRLLALVGDRHAARAAEVAAQEAIVRDVFGGPERAEVVDARWLTADVVGVARHMYAAGDFSAVPILADALEDAGCDAPDVLEHCRADVPHMMGCWVVDAVLGHRSEEARLRRPDMADPLTGVGNRRAFDVVLRQAVRRAVTDPTPLSVLSLDLDHFREVNRAFSLATGDRVLVQVTRHMRDALGGRAFLGRTGGDDFAAVLSGTDLAGALEVGERVRAAVEGGTAADGSSPPVRVTVSVGVATLDPAAPDADRLVEAAVEARRRAKSGGRNQVRS